MFPVLLFLTNQLLDLNFKAIQLCDFKLDNKVAIKLCFVQFWSEIILALLSVKWSVTGR